MNKTEFEAGIAAERQRAAEIIRRNGNDARALEILLSSSDAPAREPPPPIEPDSEHQRGVMTERRRIIDRLRAMGALSNPKQTIEAILHDDPAPAGE